MPQALRPRQAGLGYTRGMLLVSFPAYGLCGLLALLTACGSEWNNPYPASERAANTLYSAFTDRPKHLDPVQSYAEDEFNLLGQIYEPPLQYHYLKRPYTLEPLTLTQDASASVPRCQGKTTASGCDARAHCLHRLRF